MNKKFLGWLTKDGKHCDHGLYEWENGVITFTQKGISSYHHCSMMKREGSIGYFSCPFVGIAKVNIDKMQFIGYIPFATEGR